MNTLEKEQIVSIAIIGALIGSLFSGLISDRYGRKPVILISDLLFILGSILMFKCNTLSQLVIGRFIVGMGIGIACMVVPVYIAELAPTQIRGKMVTLNNLFTTGG
jgi:SP family myo-inositol transporter-like MFS transporter 13